MNKNNQKPKIRFKRYCDEWKTSNCDTIADFYKGKGYSKSDLKDCGTPVILYGRMYTKYEFVIDDVDTFAEEKEGAVYSRGNEVIVPASGESAEDIARASAVKKSGIILGGDLNIVRPNEEIVPEFLAMTLSVGEPKKDLARRAQGKSVVHLHNSDIQQIDIRYPDVLEQKDIAQYIENLDLLLKLHLNEQNRLLCIRKAMLDKMFPQNGSNVPAVRFKQFTEPWVNKPFSEVFIERHIIDTVSEEYPQLSFTIEEGVIRPEDRKTNKRDFLILDKANKKYLQTEYDDIIYNPANVIYGAIHRNGLGKGCVSPIYKIFYTEQDSTFMECIVRHPRFINAISRSMEGTVKKLKTLKPEVFLKMSAYIAPTLDEQRMIGQYFAQMDRLIEIEKEEIEKIQHIKSACLEKMFV